MFKKSISLLLSLIIVISLALSVSLTTYAISPTLSVSNESAYVGDEVNVLVDISSDSNIAAGNLVLQYDSSKLEVKSATYGSVVSSFNPIVNPNYGDTGNKIKLVIYTGTNNVITSSGTMLSVVFKAISSGNAEVKVSESRFSDINGNVISTTKSNGSVTINQKQTTSYTLSYNADGGSGAPSNQTGSTTYTISSIKPTRSGYTFLGWSKSSGATSATYSVGSNITLTANTTLYAVWSKNPYTVTLYSGTNKATSKTIETTGSLTFTTPASILGWTTLGWRNDTNPSVATHSSTGSTTVSGNSTFYAVYSKSLTVTYNANGGSGAPSSQNLTRYYNSYGSTNIISLSSTKPIRSGYTFLGWSTSSSATSATYSAGSSITLEANTTLYAVWSKNQVTTYTLSYNANGGSGAPSSQTGATAYTISSTVPTRSGYTFLGWAENSSATSANYKAGDLITLIKDTVLYAVWKNNSVVTPPVTEDFILEIRNPSKTTISYGDKIILHADVNEELPIGWSIEWTADNGNFTYYSHEESTCTISPNKSGDTTFTATLYDDSGYVISSDEQTMTSKAGFFDKIIAFFKKLFGLTKTIPQIYKDTSK